MAGVFGIVRKDNARKKYPRSVINVNRRSHAVISITAEVENTSCHVVINAVSRSVHDVVVYPRSLSLSEARKTGNGYVKIALRNNELCASFSRILPMKKVHL